MQDHRRIWIDALCINQADSDERSQQVQFMLHMAGCVAGTRSRRLHLAYFLELLAQKADDDDILKIWVKEMQASASFLETNIAVLRLLESPWFTRVWIFQEYVLGAKGITLFQLGEYRITQKSMVAGKRQILL